VEVTLKLRVQLFKMLQHVAL